MNCYGFFPSIFFSCILSFSFCLCVMPYFLFFSPFLEVFFLYNPVGFWKVQMCTEECFDFFGARKFVYLFLFPFFPKEKYVEMDWTCPLAFTALYVFYVFSCTYCFTNCYGIFPSMFFSYIFSFSFCLCMMPYILFFPPFFGGFFFFNPVGFWNVQLCTEVCYDYFGARNFVYVFLFLFFS